ncbi:hypothetical protein X975_09456, partial [Stegodyphus mimosarum]
MASVWTIVILMAFIKNIHLFSDAFPSKTDYSLADDFENFPRREFELQNICPNNCACHYLKQHLVISCDFKKLSYFP